MIYSREKKGAIYMEPINSEIQLPQIEFTQKKKERLENNYYAPMAPKTQKIMKKIQRRLEQNDQKITKENIAESSAKILWRMERHYPERVCIRDKKDLSVFNANQSPASVSKTVAEFRKRLRNSFFETPLADPPSLQGSIWQ